MRERIDPHSRGKTTLQRHETAIGEQAPLPLCAGFLRGLKWSRRAIMILTGWIEPEELRALVALFYYRLAMPDGARGGLPGTLVSAPCAQRSQLV